MVRPPVPRISRLLLALTTATLLLFPLSLRVFNRLAIAEIPALGYLPSLGLRRHHRPFQHETIERLRYGQPSWVFIGDSMLGTRIDPIYLGEISGRGNENVGFLYHAATGPAWWYLAFKNHLVASAVRPKCVFFFFRDTNLTDTSWRLAGLYGNTLDTVATDHEPELDGLVAARSRGARSRIDSALNRAYEVDVAANWMDPLVRQWFVRWRYPDAQSRAAFERAAEAAFGIEYLRADVGSDLDASETPDFTRDLPSSVLPLIMDLAEQNGLHVCFVRVQRRPEHGQVPVQSVALTRYVTELSAYVQSRGATFRDDTGDPEMTLELYGDGDHVKDRRRYTEVFHDRMAPLFR